MEGKRMVFRGCGSIAEPQTSDEPLVKVTNGRRAEGRGGAPGGRALPGAFSTKL